MSGSESRGYREVLRPYSVPEKTGLRTLRWSWGRQEPGGSRPLSLYRGPQDSPGLRSCFQRRRRFSTSVTKDPRLGSKDRDSQTHRWERPDPGDTGVSVTRRPDGHEHPMTRTSHAVLPGRGEASRAVIPRAWTRDLTFQRPKSWDRTKETRDVSTEWVYGSFVKTYSSLSNASRVVPVGARVK